MDLDAHEREFAAALREALARGVLEPHRAAIERARTDRETIEAFSSSWQAALSEGICPVCTSGLTPGSPGSKTCEKCPATYNDQGFVTIRVTT